MRNKVALVFAAVFFLAGTAFFAMRYQRHETAVVTSLVRSFTRSKRSGAGRASKRRTSYCYEVEAETSRGVESVTIYDGSPWFPPKPGDKLEVARGLFRTVEYKPSYYLEMGAFMTALGLLCLGMAFIGKKDEDLEPKIPGRS